MWKEFKEFAFKGNVLDMAVGVIIGGAFGKIVTALVNNVIMPLFGAITGGMNFSDWKWVLSPAIVDEATGAVTKAENAVTYGVFIQNVVDFLIIAFSIFVFIKLLNNTKDKLLKKEEVVVEEEPAPAAPTEAELLTEIRDLLKEKNN